MVYTQENRILALSTPLGKDALLLTKFTGREGLSRASRFTLETISEFEIDPADLIGQPVNFDVELDEGGYRVFNGIVDVVTPKGLIDEDFRRYELKIISQLDKLKKKSDNRIFQDQSLLDTIIEVLGEHKVVFSDITNGTYPPLEYCVQYQETDFQFLHRLLSETGINYRITHETGKHTVVLFDHTTHYQPTKEPVIEYVDGDSAQRKFYHWQKTVKMTSGQSSQRSFNFNRPLDTVKSHTQTIAPQAASQLYERYTYPGLNNDPANSDLEARRRMEQVENTHTQVTVSTSCRTLEPGQTFSFDRHVIERECEFEYAVTTVDYVAVDDTYLNQEGDSQVLESHLQCIPKHVLYRPTKQYPRPTVTGTQTAIVCGKPGEEIHTDEMGRIRVQFHWDRKGVRDDNTACWMRVAQPWANSGYGGQYIPRIGQEVLVHFEEGDINKPLVQGTVYNGRNKPAFDLPANKTQSGSKTRSSKGADPVEYNEIRFEDKKGQEDFHIQAQKNQTTLIKDSETRAIGNEQLLSVGKNKFTVIKNNRDTVLTEGHDKLQAQGDIAMNSVNGGIVFEAKNNIEFEVGGSQVCLTAAGHLLLNGGEVNIDGSKVNINGGHSPSGKRLSPMKVEDIFTTPAEGGTAVREFEFSVDRTPHISETGELIISRQSIFTAEDQRQITAQLQAADDAGDQAEFDRLKQQVIMNGGVSSMRGYPPTDEEIEFINNGDFIGYWKSQYDQSGGKQARTELIGWGAGDYVSPPPTFFERNAARATWTAMETYLSGAEFFGKEMPSMEDIGLELARANFDFREDDQINTPGLLSRDQHAKYHYRVFDKYGIPRQIFGGTLFGIDPETYGAAWAPYADPDSSINLIASHGVGFVAGAGNAELFMGETTELSQVFAESDMAKAIERIYAEGHGDDFMYNIDREFSPTRFLDDTFDLDGPNSGAHLMGSVQDCLAFGEGDNVRFRCVNTMGMQSASYGTLLPGGEGLVDNILSKPDDTRTMGSNIEYTVEWVTRKSELNTDRTLIENVVDAFK